MKEKKLIQRDPENYQDEINKRELAAKGIVSGTAATLIGSGLYGISKFLEKKMKSGNFRLIKGSENSIVKDLAKGEMVGKVLTGIGLPVAGISAYKHFKYKKKDKENDNKA